MGKSSKKSGTKVNAAAAVAAPAKAMKKGKREAEEAIDNRSAKKQNKDVAVEQAVEKQKSQVMAQKKNKKDETISSQEFPSSDSQEENKVKVPIKKGGIPAMELVKESGSEDSQDSSSDDEPAIKKVVPSKKLPEATEKNGTLKKAKLSSSSDDSDSLKDGDFEDEETYTKVNSQAKELPKPAPKSAATVPPKKDSGDDTSEESETDEGSSDEDEGNQVSKKTSSSDEEYSEDEEKSSEDEVESSEDEDDQASKVSKKKDTDVKMVDATAAKVKPKNKDSVSEMKSTATPLTPHAQVSKTLFVGNLPFSVEQAHVKNFFKECGEIVEVRFAMDKEGGFKGFGHVEFANARAAQKALELSGKKLLGRALRIDFAMERGSYTPNSGKENSNQKVENAQPTVYIRGFDQNAAEDNMRTLLEEHFGSCGEISRMSIPKGDDALRGYAYIDFTSSDGFSKALELNGSELEGYTLTVEEARPRGDKSFGGGRGGSGGRSGGRGGRRGGRGAGGRFGGGGRGRGGRGRGTRQT